METKWKQKRLLRTVRRLKLCIFDSSTKKKTEREMSLEKWHVTGNSSSPEQYFGCGRWGPHFFSSSTLGLRLVFLACITKSATDAHEIVIRAETKNKVVAKLQTSISVFLRMKNSSTTGGQPWWPTSDDFSTKRGFPVRQLEDANQIYCLDRSAELHLQQTKLFSHEMWASGTSLNSTKIDHFATFPAPSSPLWQTVL